MSNLIKLHWSQISMYTRCAEQFRRRYVIGEKLAPGIGIIVGKGTHKPIEVDLKHKRDTGELASEEELQDIARDTVVHGFDDGELLLSEEERGKGVEALKAECIDKAVTCATVHHRELAPSVQPVAVEREWVVNIDGFPVALAGTIDCDEGDIIDDWKTSAKSPAKGDADSSGQLTMYAMAKYTLDKVIPACRIGYMVKTKTPKAVWQETTRTVEDFHPMLRIIERISECIDKEVYPFASSMAPRPWWCSPKFCGYYATCEGVSKRTLVSMGGDNHGSE